MQVQSLDREDTLEEEMATHSSISAWKIPWTEEPARLQTLGLEREDMTGHNNNKQLICIIKFLGFQKFLSTYRYCSEIKVSFPFISIIEHYQSLILVLYTYTHLSF